MSKRNNNNQLVGGVLAAALVFAVAVGGQLDSNELQTRLIAVDPATCPDQGLMYDPGSDSCVAEDPNFVHDPNQPMNCNNLAGRSVTGPECDAADTAKLACDNDGGAWDGSSGAGVCNFPVADITCPNGSTIPAGQACTAEQNCVSPNVWSATNGCAAPTNGTTTTPAATCPSATPYVLPDGSCSATAPATSSASYPAGVCWDESTYPAGTGTPPCPPMTTTGMGCGSYTDDIACEAASGCGWDYQETGSNIYKCYGDEHFNNTTTTTTTDCPYGQFQWGDGSCNTTAETVDSCGYNETWDPGMSQCKPNYYHDDDDHYDDHHDDDHHDDDHHDYYDDSYNDQWTNIQCGNNESWDPWAGPYGQGACVPFCGHDMFWDDWKGECVSTHGPVDYTFDDFATFQSHCSTTRELNADPYCYGNHHDGWNWEDGCIDSGNKWDPYAYTSEGKGDCFPKDDFFFMPMPIGSQSLFGDQPKTKQPNWQDFHNAKTEGGEEMDYCATIGRGSLECKTGIGSETDDFFESLKNKKYDTEANYGSHAENMLDELQWEIDDVNIQTGYTYCKGVENAQSLVDVGPAAFADLGPDDTRQIFEALHMCRESVWILQELEKLQSEAYGLCESDDATDLREKIDFLIEDPSSVLEDMMNSGPGSYGPGPLEPLWMAMGDIGRGCYEHRDQMSACGFLEDSAGEIGYWLESDGYIPDAPEKTTKNVKLAEELLGNVDSVLLVAETLDPEAAKMECRRAKKDLCKFEKDNFGEHDDDSMFCNEDDFLARQLGYDDDWRNQQFSLYGETDDFEAQLEAMIAEKLAQFQESLDVIMETQIAKFMDVADRMIENAVLAAVNDALATAVQTFETALGDRVSASLNKAIGDKMSERVQYYPEEHIQKVEQNHEEILTAVNPILAALPPETLADVPEADDVLETALTELVSTEATTNIKAEVRKFENVVNSLTETDADGDIVPLEGKEEELKEETGEFFTAFEGILEDPEELEHLKEDGLVPDLGDIEEIEGTWYEEPAYAATAVLEDRPALVTGTGDGNLAPSAPFMLVEVGTILNRMTNDGEEDAGAFPGTVGIPEWAEGHMGSLVGNGTIPEDEVDDFDYYATATRDDIAYLTIRNMEATHPDFDDVDFGPCVLDNVTPDVSCDHPHADEIDAAYKIGLMTGQGDGSWDPEGEFNRAQGFKVTTLADQFLTELDNVGPDVISDVVNQ